MEQLLFRIAILITAVLFFSWAIFTLIEHGYALIFKKPLYVHFYLKLKKLPTSQLTILREHSPYFQNLTEKNQGSFEHRIVSFLSNYNFVARDGVIIDDKVKILIASGYVMLTFGMRKYLSRAFHSILIYPDAYHSVEEGQMHNGEFNPKYKAVVFSKKALIDSYENEVDNLNLAVHEFAHVLTYHSMKGKDVSSSIFSDQYQKIIKSITQFENAEKLKNSDYFRIYAFANKFEFLAVALEHFFESPEQFEKEFPELYGEIRVMLNQ